MASEGRGFRHKSSATKGFGRGNLRPISAAATSAAAASPSPPRLASQASCNSRSRGPVLYFVPYHLSVSAQQPASIKAFETSSTRKLLQVNKLATSAISSLFNSQTLAGPDRTLSIGSPFCMAWLSPETAPMGFDKPRNRKFISSMRCVSVKSSSETGSCCKSLMYANTCSPTRLMSASPASVRFRPTSNKHAPASSIIAPAMRSVAKPRTLSAESTLPPPSWPKQKEMYRVGFVRQR
mmetsp:Transcript_49693/g.139094  ORF Transcript_49693/g.139094 Transcript_49693/m.139094 type:complete len:238 (+) Transcript_49693:194-907(+)